VITISQNPFRILGLPVTATEKDVAKRISDLEMFCELGKAKEYDTDFSFLGPLERSSESVRDAARSIERPENRFYHALFWFWGFNTVDELALEVLKDGNIEKAVELLSQSAGDDAITAKNFSSHKNLAILYIALAGSNGSYDREQLTCGLWHAALCLGNGLLAQEAERLSTVAFNVDSEKVTHSFINDVCQSVKPYLGKEGGISIKEFVSEFSCFGSSTHAYVTTIFTGASTQRIETHIEKSKESRGGDASCAYACGCDLIAVTEEDLKHLQAIIEQGEIEYQLIADKLANEIFRCAVVYFNNDGGDVTVDLYDAVAYLNECALLVVVGDQTKERIEEGVETIRPMQEEAKKREQLEGPLSLITELIERKQLDTLASASVLISGSMEPLKKLRAALGSTDPLYLSVSSGVVVSAMNVIIEVVNSAQKNTTSTSGVAALSYTIDKASALVGKISAFEMDTDARSYVAKNKQVLSGLTTRLASLPASKPSVGCYIATAVYGSYDHPQVMHLREFRDQTLVRSCLGRAFIRTYYKYSPAWARRVGASSNLTRFVRRILDRFILTISRGQS
jgi:hypothetical protein